jgi:PhnB protein
MSIQGSRQPGDRTIAPNLMVRGVEKSIDFYERALGAEVVYRGTMPDGATLHAQLRLPGGSYVLLSDEIMSTPETKTGSPLTIGGSTAIFELFVDDVDAAFKKAIDAGATPRHSPSDSFYGDRVAHFIDPSGHIWSLSTVKEVLTSEELYKRMVEHFAPQGV